MITELAETGEYSHDHNSQWSLEQMCLYYIRLETCTNEPLIYLDFKLRVWIRYEITDLNMNVVDNLTGFKTWLILENTF